MPALRSDTNPPAALTLLLPSPPHSGHAIQHAVARAGLTEDPSIVDDVFLGCGMPEGETGMNIARNAALWGGLPITTSGATINRFCSSGLQGIVSAAHAITAEGSTAAVGGGVDSISLVQPKLGKGVVVERKLMKTFPALWMPMIETADLVAQRYGISRERQDECVTTPIRTIHHPRSPPPPSPPAPGTPWSRSAAPPPRRRRGTLTTRSCPWTP